MTNDDRRLVDLGDRLEAAIRREAGARTAGDPHPWARGAVVLPHEHHRRSRPQHRSPQRRGPGHRVVAAAAVAIVLAGAVGTGVALHRRGPTGPAPAVRTPATPTIQVPALGPPTGGRPELLTPEQFARDVFAHLPPAEGAAVACTSTGHLRFACTIEAARPSHDGGALLRLRFVDRHRVLGGTCAADGRPATRWTCSLAERDVDGGLLSRTGPDAHLLTG